ncbi:hypothetical protein NQZ68_011346 [Dissostichus eleginoides]|nr:hypothetical protein NQZ68_011346 [Dissostichus eleginoides]
MAHGRICCRITSQSFFSPRGFRPRITVYLLTHSMRKQVRVTARTCVYVENTQIGDCFSCTCDDDIKKWSWE